MQTSGEIIDGADARVVLNELDCVAHLDGQRFGRAAHHARQRVEQLRHRGVEVANRVEAAGERFGVDTEHVTGQDAVHGVYCAGRPVK